MPGVPSPRSATDRQALLGIYLNDHLAGATAGAQLAHRTAGAHAGTPIGDELSRLAGEIDDDRSTLLEVMRRLDVPVRHYKAYAASVGELLGRLKPNGRLVERSPVSSLVEVDGLAVGIAGKVAAWRTLRELAATDDRLDAAELDALIERALRQGDRVETVRAEVVAAFAG
jgi:hypothetical protein